MITPKQCKAARALLDWTQEDLASATKVSVGTVKNFEATRKQANYITVEALKAALEKAGVVFLDDNGVQLKKGKRS